MNEQKPNVITFISGKGGSGKTTVAIAMAKLLSEMGHPCLLIDFDMATNGASYFFKNHLQRQSVGIWEYLAKSKGGPCNMPISITPEFYFVASRARLYQKIERRTDSALISSYHEEKDNWRRILTFLMDWSSENGIEYVLVDCQAGYCLSAGAAAAIADMAIIVTEPDAISSDAADNLLIQLGADLPDERKFLVNKIDVRDAETYRNMKNVFHSLNRLPPLPFDFEVRHAFGARRMPIDLHKPSPLLFTLLETMKYVFPEKVEGIEEYKEKNVDVLFEKYEKQKRELLRRKDALEAELILIRTRELRLRYRSIQWLLVSCGLTIAVFLQVIVISKRMFMFSNYTILWSGGAVMLAAITVFAYWFIEKRYKLRLEGGVKEKTLSRQLTDVIKELDRFRSLLLARSKDFLVDAEIVALREKQDLDGAPPTANRPQDESNGIFSKVVDDKSGRVGH